MSDTTRLRRPARIANHDRIPRRLVHEGKSLVRSLSFSFHFPNLKADFRGIAMMRSVAVLSLVLLIDMGSASALETDQYYAWGRPLGDATDVVNAKLNLELRQAIDAFDQPPAECTEIAVRFRKRMRYILFHHVQIWAMQTPLRRSCGTIGMMFSP